MLSVRRQGARIRTLNCEGTSAIPGALVRFWSETLVIRVVGAPPVMTVNAPVR